MEMYEHVHAVGMPHISLSYANKYTQKCWMSYYILAMQITYMYDMFVDLETTIQINLSKLFSR